MKILLFLINIIGQYLKILSNYFILSLVIKFGITDDLISLRLLKISFSKE